MKILFSLLIIGLTVNASAQKALMKHYEFKLLEKAVRNLDKAMVEKDTVELKKLLHDDVSYGHSNGWVQSRNDLINDFGNGKILYKTINSKDHKWNVDKDWATLRTKTEIEYVLDGHDGNLNLHVLQVWIKTNRGWQLLARQSTKI